MYWFSILLQRYVRKGNDGKHPAIFRVFCYRHSRPQGRAPFGQHQESRPLARSNDIPVLNGFVNSIDWDQNQSDLSGLTLSMRRVTGSPWIADFLSWTWPDVAILGADQKERGLWGREWNRKNRRKNPVKCNACAVARKIETDCFSRNVPISNDPVVRISRNLAKK